MKSIRYLILLLAIVTAMNFVAMPVYAQQSADSLEQASRMVINQHGGRVLSAKVKEDNGKVVYRIKILDSAGHVRTISVAGRKKGK